MRINSEAIYFRDEDQFRTHLERVTKKCKELESIYNLILEKHREKQLQRQLAKFAPLMALIRQNLPSMAGIEQVPGSAQILRKLATNTLNMDDIAALGQLGTLLGPIVRAQEKSQLDKLEQEEKTLLQDYAALQKLDSLVTANDKREQELKAICGKRDRIRGEVQAMEEELQALENMNGL